MTGTQLIKKKTEEKFYENILRLLLKKEDEANFAHLFTKE